MPRLTTLALCAILCPALAVAQVFEVRQISSTGTGSPGNAPSGNIFNGITAISGDGTRVAYTSLATNLADTPSQGAQVLMADLSLPATSLISQGPFGPSDLGSGFDFVDDENIDITRDGRYVIFPSNSTNLGFSQLATNIFRADTLLPVGDPARLLLVSGFGGAPGDGESYSPSSDDTGDRVAFSTVTAFDPNDQNFSPDVYARLVSSGEIFLISQHVVAADGGLAGGGRQARISGDGTAIAFTSSTAGFYVGLNGVVDNKPTPFDDVLVKTFDPRSDGFFIIRPGFSTLGTGDYANGANDNPALSRDGLTIAFRTDATNLIAGDTNGVSDVYVAKLSLTSSGYVLDSLRRASETSTGQQLDGHSGLNGLAISDDGNLVAFSSQAPNIMPGATGIPQIYVKNMTTGTVTLVSASLSGDSANAPCGRPRISGNGGFVTFSSFANNLVSPPIEPDMGTSDVFRVRFSTPIVITPGARLDPPPPAAVQVVGNDATITFAEFATSTKRRRPRRAQMLVQAARRDRARKRRGGRGTILYQAEVRNTTTNSVRKVRSKKNVVTLADLDPGTYSVTYRTVLKQGRRTRARTPQSAATVFTIS